MENFDDEFIKKNTIQKFSKEYLCNQEMETRKVILKLRVIEINFHRVYCTTGIVTFQLNNSTFMVWKIKKREIYIQLQNTSHSIIVGILWTADFG